MKTRSDLASVRTLTLAALTALTLLTPTIARGQPGDPDRSGFTFLASLGFGWQLDQEWPDEWTAGLGGLNVGIGHFLQSDFALLLRFNGTYVDYRGESADVIFHNTQLAAVAVIEGQLWLGDRVNVEAGAGFGFIDNEDYSRDDHGYGFLAAVGYSLFARSKHSVRIGVEYAPVIANERTVHSISLSLGVQLL